MANDYRHSFSASVRLTTRLFALCVLLCLCGIWAACQGVREKSDDRTSPVSWWLTSGDQSALLQRQAGPLFFDDKPNDYPFIDVDSSVRFQRIEGFGFTLTSGSALVISRLDPGSRQSLLEELFGHGPGGIAIGFIRLSIAASDLNPFVFSYDDMPQGGVDPNLVHFSLGPDTLDLIPILQEAIVINPELKIIAAPWSAPAWMKDNMSTSGGHLLPAWYSAYARYFVQYIEQMRARGIIIDAVTPQNEPLNPNNNPSMVMSAEQEGDFVKNFLGPTFRASGVRTRIVIYDHNCDRPDYPETILRDPAAAAFVDGAAFHLYAGNIEAMGEVHRLYPNERLYFTEQYTASSGQFAGDLLWHVKNVIVGSMRNWSCSALEWNLANDAAYGPHTPGGCTTCKGGLTIAGDSVRRNVGYYIIAHASKFVPRGSVRVGSTNRPSINTVAFVTPLAKKVVIIENDDHNPARFNLRFQRQWVTLSIPGESVATVVW